MELMLVLIILTCLIVHEAHGSTDTSKLTWFKLMTGTSSGPVERRDAGIGYDEVTGSMVLFGGRTFLSKAMGDTWIYHTFNKRWERIRSSPSPAARYSFVSGLSHGYFYVAMGAGKDGIYYNDVWRFRVSNQTWEQLPSRKRPSYISANDWKTRVMMEYKPEARYGAAGGLFPGADNLYLSFGFGRWRYLDIVSYDVLQKSWYKDSPCQYCNPYNPDYPHARYWHTGTMVDADQLLIFGGCLSGGGTGGPCPSGDSWIFDGQHKYWRHLYNCLSPRIQASMAMLPSLEGERRVVLFGGIEETNQVLTTEPMLQDEVGVLHPVRGSWEIKKTEVEVGSTYPTLRASACMTQGEEGIYMFGGMETTTDTLLNDLWLLKGHSLSADQSETRECPKHFFSMLMVHGILMVIGWGLFLQWGAFVARFMKTKKQIWFYIHMAFQVFGLCCAIAGFVFGVLSVKFDHFRFAHGILGIIIMVLGLVQPLNAFCRPNQPELGAQKSTSRHVWEFVHHQNGRVVLILALINITLGVFLAVSHVIIWAIWIAYMAILVLAYVVGMCVQCALKDRDKQSMGNITKTHFHDLDHNGGGVPGNPYSNAINATESSRL